MSELLDYIGTKRIQAKPLTRGEYNKFRGWLIPADENPNDEGYLVEYTTGYTSWSPKKEFEEAYKVTTGLTCGLAIDACKLGSKIARDGWNGKNMFVYYVPALKLKTVTPVAKKEFGVEVEYNAYLVLKTVSGTVSTWVPSINDVLATDWCIVE